MSSDIYDYEEMVERERSNLPPAPAIPRPSTPDETLQFRPGPAVTRLPQPMPDSPQGPILASDPRYQAGGGDWGMSPFGGPMPMNGRPGPMNPAVPMPIVNPDPPPGVTLSPPTKKPMPVTPTTADDDYDYYAAYGFPPGRVNPPGSEVRELDNHLGHSMDIG